MKQPFPDLMNVMLEAYHPCRNMGVCIEARWSPRDGHIPRGFFGATGNPEDVEVVMVFAEPGHPYEGDVHEERSTAESLMTQEMRQTYVSFQSPTDTFHANARWFMSQLYPELSFDQQLSHIWLTEGRLCSIDNEIGATKDKTCASQYLIRQLKLMPNATVVAFGGKAKHYLTGLGIEKIDAYALAPPGANHRPARPSWVSAIEQIKAKRRSSA